MDKTWNVKMYNISILYWAIFSMFYAPVIMVILECLWRLPFGAKIVCTKTWKMTILIWTKPGDNLECYG